MKVLSKVLAVIFLFSAFSSVCFAEEGVGTRNDDAVQTIPSSSASGEQVYINNYDDYVNVLNEDDSQAPMTEEEMNEELKGYYEEYQKYLSDYYNNYERTVINKARVIEAKPSKEEYQLNYQDYSVSKFVIQPLEVEVIDGDHSGEILNIDYVLTADSLNNIILSEVKKDDIVLITITEKDDGTISGAIANSWAAVERVNKVFVIGILLVIVLLIYGGKKGFSTSLIAILSLIFAVIIIPTFAYEGNGILVVGIFEILCLIFTICAVHLGLNRNSFKAMVVSALMTAVSFGLIVFINGLLRVVGVTFEHAAIAENVILRNIDFIHLYYIITLVISSAFITNTTAMAVKKIERESSREYEEKVQNAREVLPSNIIPLFVTTLTLYIPNHLLLLTNKFGELEINNSETLLSEIIRVVTIAFCMTLIVPIVSLDKLAFGKKYLKEADDKKQDDSENNSNNKNEQEESKEESK